MPRPNLSEARRAELIPAVADVFAELGYRRATTAALAARCGVRENVLYRLWPDKRAMFVAAIEHVYDVSIGRWGALLERDGDGKTAAERVIEFESRRHGEFGLYRIVFAGLSELDDPAIRRALRRMYGRFHRFVREQVESHRGAKAGVPEAEIAAWAIVGLGTVANIGRELGLLGGVRRRRLFSEAGGALLDG